MVYIRFILHTDYSGKVLTNPVTEKEFKAGTIAYLNPINKLIYIDTIPVCQVDSMLAHKHFCRDDDGQGMLRHKYTYAIAFSKRQRIHQDGTVSRLTEEETQTLIDKWSHFIKNFPDAILFNSNFFNATIEDLQRLAKDINIRVKINDDENLNDRIVYTNNLNTETKIVNNIQIKK